MTDLQLQSQYELSLDAKNRLTIPARSRDPFRAGLALIQSHDVPAVGIEPAAEYGEFVAASLAGWHPLDPKRRALERGLNSASTPSELDGQGRVTISARLLAHAGITGRDVLLVGSGRRFELWDRERWDAYAPSLEEAMLQITNSIGDAAGPSGGFGGFPPPPGPGPGGAGGPGGPGGSSSPGGA